MTFKTLLLSPYPNPEDMDPYLKELVVQGVEWQMSAIEAADGDIWLAPGSYHFTRPLHIRRDVVFKVST